MSFVPSISPQPACFIFSRPSALQSEIIGFFNKLLINADFPNTLFQKSLNGLSIGFIYKV